MVHLLYTSGRMEPFLAIIVVEADAVIASNACRGSTPRPWSVSATSARSLQVAGRTIKEDSLRYSNLQHVSPEELSSAEEDDE